MGRRSTKTKDKLLLHLLEHNPKAFVLQLSVCTGGILHQTSRWETSRRTHLTPQLKASTGWSHKSRSPQNSPAHSTSFRMQHCSQPRFRPRCHPTSQPTMLHRPSPVEPRTKEEAKKKGQTATTLQSYEEREKSGPCPGVLWAGGGEAAPDPEQQATLLLAEAALHPHFEQRKGNTELFPNKSPNPLLFVLTSILVLHQKTHDGMVNF